MMTKRELETMKLKIYFIREVEIPNLEIKNVKDWSGDSILQLLEEVAKQIRPLIPNCEIRVRNRFDVDDIFECPYCSREFESARQLNGHLGAKSDSRCVQNQKDLWKSGKLMYVWSHIVGGIFYIHLDCWNPRKERIITQTLFKLRLD